MSEYAIRLTDLSGNKTIIKPEHTTVIAAGTTAMPSSLNGDNTYGVDISLPDSDIPEADLGVIVIPHSPTKNVIYTRYLDGSSNVMYTTHYADSGSTYYTRNDSTGVMSSWSAGNRTANDKDTWNPILGCYPIAFWDKMGQSTFSNIRLFGATAYLVRDTVDNTNFSSSASLSSSGTVNYAWYDDDGSETLENIRDEKPFIWDVSGSGAGARVAGYYMPYTEADSSCILYEEFSTPKILEEIVVNYLADMNPKTHGGNASASCVVSIYIDSTWYDIITISLSGYQGYTDTIYAYGYWRNVSKIRASISVHTQSGRVAETVWSTLTVGELYGYGPNDTDADENKTIYSISSSNVVDYLVTMRKYNY